MPITRHHPDKPSHQSTGVFFYQSTFWFSKALRDCVSLIYIIFLLGLPHDLNDFVGCDTAGQQI